MYSFYSASTGNSTVDFSSLIDAIKNHDDLFVMQSLTNNPEFIKKTTDDGDTPLQYAAKSGCPLSMFLLLLEKSFAESAFNYEQIKTILALNKRNRLINTLDEFMQINGITQEQSQVELSV